MLLWLILKQNAILGIKDHKGKTKKVNNFTTYDCPGKSYKGEIGFAQVDGNGIVLLFSK